MFSFIVSAIGIRTPHKPTVATGGMALHQSLTVEASGYLPNAAVTARVAVETSTIL